MHLYWFLFIRPEITLSSYQADAYNLLIDNIFVKLFIHLFILFIYSFIDFFAWIFLLNPLFKYIYLLCLPKLFSLIYDN